MGSADRTALILVVAGVVAALVSVTVPSVPVEGIGGLAVAVCWGVAAFVKFRDVKKRGR